MTIRRGDIYFCNLEGTIGSEQGGERPVLIIQNDLGNKYSPTVIAAAITSQTKNKLPTHIEIKSEESNLPKNSTVLLEQIRTLDKSRLKGKMGEVGNDILAQIDIAMAISLGMMSKPSRIVS